MKSPPLLVMVVVLGCGWRCINESCCKLKPNYQIRVNWEGMVGMGNIERKRCWINTVDNTLFPPSAPERTHWATAPSPIKTRQKVPRNSARKWRRCLRFSSCWSILKAQEHLLFNGFVVSQLKKYVFRWSIWTYQGLQNVTCWCWTASSWWERLCLLPPQGSPQNL